MVRPRARSAGCAAPARLAPWRGAEGLEDLTGRLPVATPQGRGIDEPGRAPGAGHGPALGGAGPAGDPHVGARALAGYGEALFLESVGDCGSLRAGVSAGCRELQVDFEAWPRRALSALKGGFLFLDAIDLAGRQGRDDQEGGLCADGIGEMRKQGCWLWCWGVARPPILATRPA
jgi:hypothetical protein